MVYLGGQRPKRWGRYRPIRCFFHGDSAFHCVGYLLRLEEIASATG